MPVLVKVIIFLTGVFSSGLFLTRNEKMSPVKPKVRVFAVDKYHRTVSFVTFQDLDSPNQPSYLANDIPKSIAITLRNTKKITVPKSSLHPVINGKDAYLIKIFSNHFERKIIVSTNTKEVDLITMTNFELPEGVFSNVANSNVIYYYSNLNQPAFFKIREYKTNRVQTLKKYSWSYKISTVASNLDRSTNLFYSDIVTKSYTNYLTNKNHSFLSNYSLVLNYTNDFSNILLYFTNNTKVIYDLRLSSNVTLEPDEFIYNYKDPKEGEFKILFKETNNFIRKLEIKNSIIVGSNFTLNELIKRGNSDFIIFGNYSLNINNELALSIFMIDSKHKTVELIFKRKIASESLFEEISGVPSLILAAIEKKGTAKQITFTSNPRGAYLYINDVFLGLTPITINEHPLGKYPFRIEHPMGELDFESSIGTNYALTNNQVLLNNLSFGYTKNNLGTSFDSILIGTNNLLMSNHFVFKEQNEVGTLVIQVTNNKNTDIFINSEAVALGTTYINRKLLPGNYFVTLSGDDLAARYLNISIQPRSQSLVSLSMNPPKVLSPMRKAFFDHNRNFKVSGITALSFIAGGIYYSYMASQYDDKYLTSLVKSSLTGNLDYNTTSFYRSEFLRAQTIKDVLFSAAGLFGGITLLSYTLDVKKNTIKIESIYNRSKDVTFQITTESKF